jgi:L-alanine-DL-glutamate epimerase-like enolase superfamily enzyme
MALFPKIQSPCPYKNDLAALMDGDMCRMCNRQVVDLNGMSDGERVALMAGCSGDICVTYKLSVRPVLAAAALAAMSIAVPTAAAAQDATSEIETIVGGIKDTAHVEYVQDPADATIPELPVVFEKKPPAAKSDAGHATPPSSNRPSL